MKVVNGRETSCCVHTCTMHNIVLNRTPTTHCPCSYHTYNHCSPQAPRAPNLPPVQARSSTHEHPAPPFDPIRTTQPLNIHHLHQLPLRLPRCRRGEILFTPQRTALPAPALAQRKAVGRGREADQCCTESRGTGDAKVCLGSAPRVSVCRLSIIIEALADAPHLGARACTMRMSGSARRGAEAEDGRGAADAAWLCPMPGRADQGGGVWLGGPQSLTE